MDVCIKIYQEKYPKDPISCREIKNILISEKEKYKEDSRNLARKFSHIFPKQKIIISLEYKESEIFLLED
jgi:catabolite regulation protein CreA